MEEGLPPQIHLGTARKAVRESLTQLQNSSSYISYPQKTKVLFCKDIEEGLHFLLFRVKLHLTHDKH